METIELTPIPAGDNPFRHDLYHAGMTMARNVVIMGGEISNERDTPYIIIINQKTGERLLVIFDKEEAERKLHFANLTHKLLAERE